MTGLKLVLMLGLARLLPGQTPPEFEVASVKLVDHPVPPHAVSLIIKHGTLTMDAAALRQIIGLAYGIQRVRVVGGPDWLDSNLYDIQAKAENQLATPDEIRPMLQTLLTERFKLAVRRETRQVPVFTLVVAKGGPKLQEAKEDEKSGVTGGAASGRRQITMNKTTMAGLVNLLANLLHNPVHDETGLKGFYDFKLDWAPDGPARPDAAPAETGPSLVTAVQEQLGLKLEEKKGPVEVLVVEHAEPASAN